MITMLFLYTSDTCPKGVSAQQYLNKTGISFSLVNIDQPNMKAQVDVLWQLLRNWQEDPRTPLVLPVLTKKANQQEEILLIGYDPKEWSEVFQPSQSSDAHSESSNMPQSFASVTNTNIDQQK